ncbi:MAG TPA: hypothetical protein VE528_07045, partial [Thermoleophilaceae bacterium]|nr:hypothetical protein [Thermoleophilaceae bacterium]
MSTVGAPVPSEQPPPAHRGLAELRPGDALEGVLACVRKDRLTTRTGSPYLSLELRDRTGSLP